MPLRNLPGYVGVSNDALLLAPDQYRFIIDGTVFDA